MSEATTTTQAAPTTTAAPAAAADTKAQADSATAPASGGAAPSSPTATTAQANSAAAALASATEQPTAAGEERQWTIKVNGKEKTVGEAEMVKLAQMADGASEKFREAADLKKQSAAEREQTRAVVEAIKANPMAMLERMGIDVYKVAEDYFAERLRLEQMDPNERRRMELDAREEKLRRDEEERQRSAQSAAIAREAERFQAQFTADLSAALDKAGVKGMDRAEYIPRAAALMEASLGDDGMPTISMDEIAQIIAQEEGGRRSRYRDTTIGEFSSLSGDALLAALPPELVKGVQDALLSKVKAPQPFGRMAPPAAKPPEPPRSKTVIRNAEDLRKYRQGRSG